MWRSILVYALLALVSFDIASSLMTRQPSEQKQPEQRTEESYRFTQSLTYRGAKIAFEWIDGRHDFVTTAATIVIAIFTATLWRATEKLWKAGEKQMELIEANAISQTKGMQASIATARDVADATKALVGSDRAWMTFDGFNTEWLTNATIDGITYPKAVGISLNWKNTGRSPALRVNAFIDQKILPTGSAVPWFAEKAAIGENERRMIGGPGWVARSLSRVIDDDTFQKIGRQELVWFVYSKVTYSTVFDPEASCYTEICLMVATNGQIRQPNGVLIPNLNLCPIGPQNTAG